MVEKARSKNITPIFVTSIARLGTVEADRSQTDTTPNAVGNVFMDYVNAMKDVAKESEMNVAVLDLNDAFIDYYLELEEDGLLGGPSADEATISDCFYVKEDGTHPTKKGAQWLAETIVKLIKASDHESLAALKKHIVE